MILTRGIWPLRRATLWYEPAETVREYMRGYARIHAYSYTPLDVPGLSLFKEKQTPVIDVRGKTAEEVLAGFRDTTRNEVRRTFAMPEVSFAAESQSRELYDFYVAATRSQGRTPQKRGLFRDASFVVARKEGDIVAAISFVHATPIVKVLTISSLRRETVDSQERNLIGFCTKRLVYELCALAVNEGYDAVDLAYINLADPTKKGINDFKVGFGGEVRTEWQYEYRSVLFKIATTRHF